MSFKYFATNGRAINIRAILSVVKANWKNNIVQYQDFLELKASGKLEYGQLPAVEHNGKFYVQSIALETYLAKKFGIFGSNIEEEYEITNILASRQDFIDVATKVLNPISEEEKTNLEKNKTDLTEVHFPKFFKIYENRLLAGKGEYLVGDKFSLADIQVTLFIFNFLLHPSRKDAFAFVLDKFEKLKSYVHKILENEFGGVVKNEYFRESLF